MSMATDWAKACAEHEEKLRFIDEDCVMAVVGKDGALIFGEHDNDEEAAYLRVEDVPRFIAWLCAVFDYQPARR